MRWPGGRGAQARPRGFLKGWKGPADGLYAGFGELRSARAELDRLIEEWTARLDERWLAQDFTYTSRIDGRTHTLLSQLGIDPGVTDLPWLPGLTSGKESTSPEH